MKNGEEKNTFSQKTYSLFEKKNRPKLAEIDIEKEREWLQKCEKEIKANSGKVPDLMVEAGPK